MILHIVEEEKFLNTAIEIFENINPKKNIFIVGVKSLDEKFKYLNKKNIQFIHYSIVGSNDYENKIQQFVKKADLIFFHNLYKEYKFALFRFIPKQKKIAWYFWGAELYGLYPGEKINNLLPLTEKKYYASLPLLIYLRKRVLSKIKKIYYWNRFKSVLKNRVDYILTNISEDIDLLNEYCPSNAKRGWFTYFSYDFDSSKVIENNSEENILIGNSSSPTNNHFDMFEMLKTKDITGRKIIIPLNYGDPLYKNYVVNSAKENFGKQACPIIDFMPLADYNNLINSCSILIMNHKRQQAFNTIMLAISNGCKVFLREENTIYKYLKGEGFKVFSIEQSFNSANALERLEKVHIDLNIKLIDQIFSSSSVKKKIYEEIHKILNE